MSSPTDQIEAVLADLVDKRRSLDGLRAEISRRKVTVRSANRLLSVSVDARGGVVNVAFHSTAYTRMTPDELGRLVAETTAEAQAEMARGIAEQLAPYRDVGRAVRESLVGGMTRPTRTDREADRG